MPEKSQKKPRFTPAQLKQRALYKAQMQNPPRAERIGGWASDANRLAHATGIRVNR